MDKKILNEPGAFEKIEEDSNRNKRADRKKRMWEEQGKYKKEEEKGWIGLSKVEEEW